MLELHYLLKHKRLPEDTLKNETFYGMSNNVDANFKVMCHEDALVRLKELFEYHRFSNCTKTKVACAVYNRNLTEVAHGVNYVFGVDVCKVEECKRDFGMNPSHRHNICKAIHSEVLALRNWYGGTIEKEPYHAFVTRYPCQDCCAKMSALGVRVIYYSTMDSNGHINILDEDTKNNLQDYYNILIIKVNTETSQDINKEN